MRRKRGLPMLKVWFGGMHDAIYDMAVYFRNTYLDERITKPLSVRMIADIDRSEVVGFI